MSELFENGIHFVRKCRENIHIHLQRGVANLKIENSYSESSFCTDTKVFLTFPDKTTSIFEKFMQFCKDMICG